METCAMDERIRFVLAAEERDEAVAMICRRFGVSRKTGYKWWARDQAAGLTGLAERSRAPLHHPRAMAGEIAARCLLVASGASNLGAGEGVSQSGAALAPDSLAGAQHDRGDVRPRGTDGQAPSAPPRPACAIA